MSLHTVAKHMAAQGRGPDTQLIHMSPREVQGLQALAMAHGGSLTINPHTGLPEAGFLDSMLPTILGAGAMFLSGGAINPATIGLITGGIQTARTGSLGKGILAGLGAYGGAGLAGGAMSAGAAEASGNVAAQGAEQQATADAARINAENAAATANETGTQQAIENSAQQQAAAQQAQQSVMTPEAQGLKMGEASQQALGRDPSATFGQNLSNRASGMWEGAKSAVSGEGAGSNAFGSYMNAQGTSAGKLGLAALAPVAADAMQPKMNVPTQEKYTGPLSRYSMSDQYKPYEAQQPNPYYQAQYQNYRGFAAGGGVIEQMSNANAVGANTGYPMADIQQGAYSTPWQTPISRNVVADSSDSGVDSFTGEPRGMARGGIASLGGYSDGGQMLKGPGDGMSDSIPAQIGGKQPARLADGEFVVPADVVSHLGNGSSDAGAKQLYKMMDRIRQQRTGKKKQAPEVNPTKAMPA